MKKLLISIFLTLTLCFGLVFIKNQYGRFLFSNSTYGMEPLISKQILVDNLFLGSSMFRQGIDIGALENQASGFSWILAYNGNQPITEYYELKYLLDHGVKIKTLFLDMYAYAMTAEVKISDERLFLHTDIPFKLSLCRELSRVKGLGISELWQMFVTSNNEMLLTWFLHKKMIEPRYRNGGNLAQVPSLQGVKLTERDLPVAEQLEFRAVHKQFLIKILELCRENEIEVVMIETPKHTMLANSSEYKNMMKEYILFLRDHGVEPYLARSTVLALAGQGFEFDESRIVDFDSDNLEFYRDVIHLSSKGREKYTSNLLKKLKRE